MKKLPTEALDCVKKERVGVIAVKMPDGVPHGATVHFAWIDNPLTFIFLTSPTYRKVEPLRNGDTPATFVIGTTEELNKTLQMDGYARLQDSEEIRQAYFAKFPEKLGKHPDNVFFAFTPTWWRFTDWTLPQGKTIWRSDDEAQSSVS